MQNRYLFLHCSLGVFVVLIIQQHQCNAQISVQQPIVETFGAATTVAVPDRGEIHLGSIGVARDARNFFGPRTGLFPRGSSLSRERTHSSLSVRATIQDFNEMDQTLLNKTDGAAPLPFEEAMHSSRYLLKRYGVTKAPRPTAPAPRSLAPAPVPRKEMHTKKDAGTNSLLKTGKTSNRVSQKYLQQGIQAEKQGNKTLAKIYYRLAISNGSTEARNLLNLLNSN